MKKNTLPNIKQQLGFTMIELLIVLTILGILATAVLSAINPIEQINRGRDTASKSDAEQLLSAIDRFYAFNGYYPWVNSAEIQDSDILSMTYRPVESVVVVDAAGDDVAGCGMLEILSDGDTDLGDTCPGADELKLSFVQRIARDSYNSLWIYNSGETGSSTYICYAPKSAAFNTESTTRCDSDLPVDFPDTACNAEAEATPTPAASLMDQIFKFNLKYIHLANQVYAQTPTEPTAQEVNYVCLP
ncbi:MAG: type II secretion system protein [Patescibacteria group bacterium]|nr:type II secretion system protein [Patescibacteria group bacterium]